ncbi:MAG: hypothetical protein ABL921_21330 [Pirellula sp.]
MRSAGTSGKTTIQFIEAISQSVLRQDVDELIPKLQSLDFDRLDATLIATAVASTRNLAIPASDEMRQGLSAVEFNERVVDGLAVTFMFNVVNRIANLFELQPEWHSWRLNGAIRTASQAMMAIGLPHQMPIGNESQQVLLAPKIAELLCNFRVVKVSPIWGQLKALPSIEFAIYQLMSIAIQFSSGSPGLIDEVTDSCLCHFGNTLDDASVQPISRCCRQLFLEPFKSCDAWSRLDLSDRTKLDIAFWVSLLAAIHQLNSNSLARLVHIQ